ncbi:MarR family winged helix-turn-helix transcriptional regulator [Streptomyces sp. NPDC007983]|uniref:MarR family winged helix-turn-helix transcriptional regulator n=1 Tax=Streptomyces sp. NPDC007983 TaxID=3364800 RepID=UPI0036E5C82D
MTTSEPSDTAQLDQVGTLYLVKRLEQAIRAHLDALLRPLGLTTLQYTALTVLERRDGLSSAQLARRSFVKPQTMHEMVQTLEERGFIERRRDPANRRVLLISLSDRGREALRAYDEQVRLLEERMLGGLTEDRRGELRQALIDCTRAMSATPPGTEDDAPPGVEGDAPPRAGQDAAAP